MYIRDANLQLEASHSARTRVETQEHFALHFASPGKAPERIPNPSAISASSPLPASPPDLSRAGALLRLERQELSFTNRPLTAQDQLQILVVEQLYRQATGREMTLSLPELTQPGATFTLEIPIVAPRVADTQSAQFGMIYQRTQLTQESANLQFRATGEVTTREGRTINIEAVLTMQRDYIRRESVTVRAGSAALIDPLVINFDGLGAQLSDQRFAFDLDNNGTREQIASLHAGSGYLALDRNQDGKINHGGELFGPSSGQGFRELAEFDADANGFIDEGDAIYDKLRIWRRFDDGTEQLMALGQAGVGAIYLGHVTSPFSLKGTDNQTLGEVASTSIYLREDGSVGAVQQVNLAV
ncbi:hypothetical protein [Gilvimarinus sp. 1_MG-2023]|uniref:hypothetical protein n=1 Tax=Gilvimarinus sp. 1_MG-2023 TaxID=3062638 RepID=UPI0026E1AA94|nr:hypothetical protein [Gilvimarinus sp. 1_MG-2023]MDO6747451.1 hypothetical protein [Gilvimarinus sp. 1_MG-2023]